MCQGCIYPGPNLFETQYPSYLDNLKHPHAIFLGKESLHGGGVGSKKGLQPHMVVISSHLRNTVP